MRRGPGSRSADSLACNDRGDLAAIRVPHQCVKALQMETSSFHCDWELKSIAESMRSATCCSDEVVRRNRRALSPADPSSMR